MAGALRGRSREGDTDPSWMSYARSPDGPWSQPQQIFKDYVGSDTNFAREMVYFHRIVALCVSLTRKVSQR